MDFLIIFGSVCACVAAEFWALLHSGSGPGAA